ncbi:Phage protein D [Tistlia consotensis]|uniref:Phage protein D n=1 Tax=Tistlia consotensis USBA 355 TaxID=560819 RepID=A0A1Y6BCQ4_9PROT|nr:phage late control D family protein [Tistlia consotensis]SMF02984.1 Phage protein D [Tistlia consotensis USBA 355]SNR53324.1 Phage protein D [Tistlia consotensis]
MTAAFRTVLEEAARPGNRFFYAPAFQVRIDGENLPQNVLRDVLELKYVDGLTEIDSFEITVNNWDPDSRSFKFIGSEPADYMTGGDAATRLYRLFQPCEKTVEIRLGYADELVTMMLANFTTMEPHFPASAAPTLTVTGLNVLHQLRRKKYTTAWVSRTPSWIARNIATLRDHGQPRFPLPIAVDPEAEGREPALDYTAQTSQYDVDFLLNLARQHGYELVVQEANEEAGTPRQLYFGPGASARPPVNFRLDWGSTLIEFEPTITSHNQWKSVTVNGWDRQAQRPIRETVNFDDPELRRLNADLREFVQCDPREELVVDRPMFSRDQARDLARSILRDRAASVVKAKGTSVGLPDLRAGTKVYIGHLGARLSGEYLVTKTGHGLTDAGYTVRFEARREQLGEAGS